MSYAKRVAAETETRGDSMVPTRKKTDENLLGPESQKPEVVTVQK